MSTEDPPKPPSLPTVDEELAKLRILCEKQEAEIIALNERYEPTMTTIVKAAGTYGASEDVPTWVEAFENSIEGLVVDDTFTTSSYRENNRFKGLDFFHSSASSCKLSQYRVFETPRTNWMKVEAVVQFTKNAEGAKGWVHRGAVSALMDDAANFAGFNISGELNLFSGFTKQVFTTYSRPVRIGAILKLIGQVERVRNRTDIIITCSLIDPSYNNALHAKADCIFVMNESAAEMLEPLVAMKQKERGNSGADKSAEWNTPEPWSVEMSKTSFETVPDPAFRPPNRVGRYGLGSRIDDDLAQKIDERTARTFIPKAGSLIKNAEKHVTKKRIEQERTRLEAEEELERERVRNHPARGIGRVWGARSDS
jgi:acyl-CoA hydrolase